MMQRGPIGSQAFPIQGLSKDGKPYIRVEYRDEQKESVFISFMSIKTQERNNFFTCSLRNMVLLKMKATAESYLGCTINNAVFHCLCILQ